MKELADILRIDRLHRQAGVEAALATVVRVNGSSYRRPGARMLVSSDGQITGGVSGGCLERDVIVRAGAVILSGQPALVRYDTTTDFETGATGYSLGCGGTIDVLIESLRSPAGVELLNCLEASRHQRTRLVTVISKQNSASSLGTRMVVYESGQFDGLIGDTALSAAIAEGIQRIGRSQLLKYPTRNGVIELFAEVLNPPLKLVVFGAGNDALPLVGFANALGWQVTVVDLRSAAPDLSRKWEVNQLVLCSVDEVASRLTLDQSTAAVVMTHNFVHDQKLILWLRSQSLQYLGLLGPRHRTEELLGGIAVEGLHSPVGLDLGADNPEEVALAIVAEITAALRGRSGAPLSRVDGPIHPDSPKVSAVEPVDDEVRGCPVAES